MIALEKLKRMPDAGLRILIAEAGHTPVQGLKLDILTQAVFIFCSDSDRAIFNQQNLAKENQNISREHEINPEGEESLVKDIFQNRIQERIRKEKEEFERRKKEYLKMCIPSFFSQNVETSWRTNKYSILQILDESESV